MARTHHSRASSLAPGAARHKVSLQQRKPSYKVVLEEVTEKKKKLLTHLVFNTTAPAGYTFIPAGDPQLTNRCKEFARQDGSDVFIVSAASPRRASTLTKEIHRVGYHFPSTVVENACTSLSISLSRSGRVIYNQRVHAPGPIVRNKKKGKTKKRGPLAQRGLTQLEASQAEIDTEAKEAIKDLFANIPDHDLYAVVRLAFKKGSRLVGTAPDLPLTRRAQLGVLAHIRHTYTNYDQLLKVCGWTEARAAVEHLCLEKIAQWRGDDDDTDAMSDILREVIVIPDDEEENSLDSEVDGVSISENREASVEVVATRAAADGVHVRQVTYRHSPQGDHDTDVEPNGPFMGTYKALSTNDRSRLDRAEAHRHRTWAAAQSRYRNEPHHKDHNNNSGISTWQENNTQDKFPSGLRPDLSVQTSDTNKRIHVNDHTTYDDRILHASAIQDSFSTHREAMPNRIVDLTTGRPYQPTGQPALDPSPATSWPDTSDKTYGRPIGRVFSHQITDKVTRELAVVADERPRQARRPQTEHHSDQILPSIEQPSDRQYIQNPFQQRRSENQNTGPNGPNGYAEHYESKNPLFQVPVNSYTDTGKEHGPKDERAYASPYNNRQAATGTVLIPLEEYHRRHRREAQFPDAGQGHTLRLPRVEENNGSPYRVKDGSSLHESPVTAAYAGRTWSPQQNTQWPAGQHQRPPHLQVQLHSRAQDVVDARRSSPYAFHIPQSDSPTSPTSQLDRTVAHRASGHPFFTRTSSVNMGSEFREGNVLMYAPTAARVEQDASELQASYTNHNSALNKNKNPFQKRNASHYSYSRSEPAIRVAGSWGKAFNMQGPHIESPQHLLETRPVARTSQQNPFLPVRSRQAVIQPFEGLSPNNAHGKPVLTPTYQSQGSLSTGGSDAQDRPVGRPNIVTFVPYATGNEASRSRMHIEPLHIRDPRRELVVID